MNKKTYYIFVFQQEIKTESYNKISYNTHPYFEQCNPMYVFCVVKKVKTILQSNLICFDRCDRSLHFLIYFTRNDECVLVAPYCYRCCHLNYQLPKITEHFTFVTDKNAAENCFLQLFLNLNANGQLKYSKGYACVANENGFLVGVQACIIYIHP